MSNLDHILLYLFSFLLFYIWGKCNYKRKSYNYWLSALLPLLIVSFIIGSRTWGADYSWYKYQFEHAFNSEILQEEQPLFVYFNRFLSLCGFDYVGAFMLYSFVYLIASFSLYRSFGESSKYMYAFLLTAYLDFGASIIRQTFALGFAIYSILYFNGKKWIGAILFLIIATQIHSASIIFIVFFIGFKLIDSKVLPIHITIPLYLVLIFFFKPEWLNGLSSLFAGLNLGESKFQSYVDNSDIWFSQEGMNDIYSQGIVALVLNTAFVLSLFILGYKALIQKPQKDIIVMYNMMVVGYIGLRFFFNLEILRRFFIPNTMLYPVVLGYALYVFQNRLSVINYAKNKKIIKLCYFAIALWLFLYWGRFIFLQPDYKFFWD